MLASDGLRRTLKCFLTAIILYMVAKTAGDLIQTCLRPKAAQCFVNHWCLTGEVKNHSILASLMISKRILVVL